MNRALAGFCLVSLVTCHVSLGFAAEELRAYAKALAAYQDRQLDKAFQYAREAVAEEPESADAHALLGQLYYGRQELTQAQASWERALTLAPSRQDVRQHLDQLAKELSVERTMARSDTYPFVVRFAQGRTPEALGDLRALLRDAYRLVGQSFGYFPEHPIPVILYPETEFQQVRGLSHQVAGFYDGKIRLPLRPGLRTTQELQRIFWHEYTHAIVHDVAKGRCPMWFNEGVATLQEGRVRAPDLSRVREARRAGRLVPWHVLWEEQQYHLADRAGTELRYQQASLIAQYLVKRGHWSQLTNLLKRMGQGAPMEEALRAEYHVAPAQLEREWATWLRREVP